MTKELIEISHKCPQCYIVFSTMEFVDIEHKADQEDSLYSKLCDFCVKHPWYPYHKDKLAERMIDILDKTAVGDLPEILKFLFSQVKFKEE